MADSRVYTLDQLDDLEETNQEKVTPAHLNYAMNHVIRILGRSAIPYAVMGGMSMIMRGYFARSTTDVDIAVQSDARAILRALESDTRVLRPRIQMVAGSGVARIFVATGPAYRENVTALAVEVDLILNGNRGAPRSLDGRSVAQIDWTGPSGTARYNILSLQEIFVAKLAAYYQRDGANDYSDLVWMCLNQAARVRAFSDRLDQVQRGYFVEALSESGTASRQQISEIRRILNL